MRSYQSCRWHRPGELVCGQQIRVVVKDVSVQAARICQGKTVYPTVCRYCRNYEETNDMKRARYCELCGDYIPGGQDGHDCKACPVQLTPDNAIATADDMIVTPRATDIAGVGGDDD